MEKIKIGYLPLYIKLYDDSNPHYRDPMVEHMNMMISMLESQGLEIIKASVCRTETEFEEAIKIFNNSDIAAVITQHLAYSPSLESINSLKKLNYPIIILDTTPDYSIVSCAGYKNCISANHGIHGVQDMCNLLQKNGIPFHLCTGHALHSEVISEVVGLCKAAKVAELFKNSKIGSIGGSFKGMGDFLISPEKLKKTIGAEVFNFNKENYEEIVSSVSEKEINNEIKWEKLHFTSEIKDEKNYKKSILSGLVVRKWMEENNIDSCTINFLDLDKCGLPKMPFTECSKIMMKGKGYAGEGDVLTAGLVGALLTVYPNTTFTEMFCPDWEKNVILLSHMGEMNFNLSQWKPVLADLPFNYNSCGNTSAAYGCLRKGKAILINLNPMQNKFKMIVSEVDMMDYGLEFGAYRYSNQGWLKPSMPITKFLKEYSINGGTHHSALVYNANINEIITFGKMMGFEIVKIGE